MKLFQQMLVAPAALGLMAPIAATAAELNINEISDYNASGAEVQGISQFSDVYPTDWAYQALTQLAERHGCVAAAPNGSMTRYEAAALLNTCLGEVAQVNEEERRLLNEFSPELAVIKGRIDSLEARVGEFEAGVFSTTTKLRGTTHFVIGAVDEEDNATDATVFVYSTQLDLTSSFTGKDVLYTRFKTGNFGNSQLAQKPNVYLSSANTNDDTLKVDKIWYQFPVGDSITAWLGAKVENYYMLASAPSVYRPILKGFALGGNDAVYGASTGQGFGVAWTQQVDDPSAARFAVSANYTSSNSKGEYADPTAGGLFTNGAQGMTLAKVEYGSPRWQVSVAYSNKTNGSDAGTYYSTTMGDDRTGNTDAYALRAYWKPETTGAIPSISAGYTVASVDDDGTAEEVEETASWMVGLNWKDAFIDGNTAGVAFGQRQYATSVTSGNRVNHYDKGDDNFNWEAYYSFKVSDGITVTPAVFGVSNPDGDDQTNGDGGNGDTFGGIVQTTFKF